MKRSWGIVSIVGLCAVLQTSGAREAAAQCDPGMPVNEIRQSHTTSPVGWVARVEVRAGVYTEHWCLLRGFRNFGSDSTTTTSFRPTADGFNATRFVDNCRDNSGAYHVASVEQRF